MYVFYWMMEGKFSVLKMQWSFFIAFCNLFQFRVFSAQRCLAPHPKLPSAPLGFRRLIQPVWSQCGLGITVLECWDRAFAWVRKALHVKWWGKLLWNENQCSFTNPGLGSLRKTQCHNSVSLGWCSHSFRLLNQTYLDLLKSVTCKGLIPPPRGFFLFGQTPTDGVRELGQAVRYTRNCSFL